MTAVVAAARRRRRKSESFIMKTTVSVENENTRKVEQRTTVYSIIMLYNQKVPTSLQLYKTTGNFTLAIKIPGR